MVNFRNAKFITSLADAHAPRPETRPELLLVGRSNVGKSSLINALVDQKNLARTSSKPGHTRLLNLFDIDHTFYLVDAPGYGYTRGGGRHVELFATLMEDYFHDNANLVGVLWLLDSRHDLSKDDQTFFTFLLAYKINVKIILTKADKLNQKMLAEAKKRMQVLLKDYPQFSYYFFSIDDANLIRNLRSNIYPW